MSGEQNWDPASLALSPEIVEKRLESRKALTRRQQFIKVPGWWAKKLMKASGPAWAIAVSLLRLCWERRERTIKLANGWLKEDGINRYAKYRALTYLESAGLIAVERRPRKPPVVTVLVDGVQPR
jgi:hypothetical protein